MEVITSTDLDLKLFSKGKVREVYEMDGNLLMIATDRLSAFDVVFNEGIPFKGAVLNGLSAFWFSRTKSITKNHLVSTKVPNGLPGYLNGRSMLVVKSKPLPIECIVRGYITGSALKEYDKTGKVCGIELPKGMKNGDAFPEPIFTPSTKAEIGQHDENITQAKAAEIIGKDAFEEIKEKAIKLYNHGNEHARKCGLVLADTKFEFGYLGEGNDREIILIDEAMTPDSSRYWLKEKYDSGVLESLDKQYVRDYLEKMKWNKSPPPPALPKEVVENTSKRYLEAYRKLTGSELKI
jgi:phosphoribosylaminoimidazole-succinocarboxamide synthase